MKICVLAGVVFFVTGICAGRAVENEDLASAIGNLQATLQSIPALTAISSSSYAMTPEYYEHNKVTPAERPGHNVERKTILAGPAYRLTVRSVSKNGELYEDEDFAYDGHLFQRFNHVNDSLSIWEKTPVNLYDLYASPLDQFGFLRNFTREKTEALRFDELKSPELWARILTKAKFLGYRLIGDRRVLSFEFTDTYDSFPSRYEVDLSPEHGFFPLHWAAYSLQGDLFQEYKVTEFGKASFDEITYYYPKFAVGQFFGITGKFIGKPFINRIWETSSLAIDPVDPDVFTIDPLSVRAIVDQDTKTAITMPK